MLFQIVEPVLRRCLLPVSGSPLAALKKQRFKLFPEFASAADIRYPEWIRNSVVKSFLNFLFTPFINPLHLFNFHSRYTTDLPTGYTPLGGCNPIRLHSMTYSHTHETEPCV